MGVTFISACSGILLDGDNVDELLYERSILISYDYYIQPMLF